MLRSAFVTLVFAATIPLNCGCTSSTDPSSADGQNTEGSDRPKIALVMKSLANEFFSAMQAGAETHQSEHADQYDLISNGIKDERDIARQNALVDEMVAAQVDAIVIAPADSKALIPAIRRAQKKGVIVVNIDNRLDEELLTEAGIKVPFVGPDNRVGAKAVGDYLASKLSDGDEVAILEGLRTSFNGKQRHEGYLAAAKEGNLQVVDSQAADWELSNANRIASAMLNEHPKLKAILAANDSMALGALTAIRSADKTGDVFVVGFDNIPAARQAIEEGRMLATAEQYGDQLAVFGIETALEMLADADANPQDVETPVDLVTAETLAE